MSEDRDQPVVRLSTGRTSSVTQAPGEDSPVASLRSPDRSTETLFGPRSMPRPATPGSLRETYESGIGQIGRAVGDIPRFAGGVLSSFFTALKGGALTPRVTPPTREGREAGGEFLSQASDIGMAVTGGGAVSGPIETPRQAGRMATGFGTPEPPPQGVFDPLRRPPPPGPQLALPPPAIPPGAETRALPPPTFDIPGRPIPTPGPGDVRAQWPTAPAGVTMGPAGPRAATPEPFPRRVPGAETQVERDIAQRAPTGAIPRPGATMRPTFGPPPQRPLTAAEAAGAAAGRDLPPRAPGTEGRPGRVEPLIPVGAERGSPSPLATALLENDVSAIDRKLSNRFRQATGSPRARSQGELDMQDRYMTTAVDSIIFNKDNIQFRDPKDPTGNTLQKSGQLPRNLSEFTQAIAYLKRQLFQEYDQMATRVTGQGAQISLAPTVTKLRQWAQSPSAGISQTIRSQALQMADEFEQLGSYTPSAAQEVVQTLNSKLSNFLNGVHTEEIYSHPTLMNDVRDTLLSSLDQTMARALGGPQYQNLRLRYGSLSAVEGNVANALSRQLGKRGGPFSRGLTTPEALAAYAGTLHFGAPGAMMVGGTIAGSRGLSRFLLSPNYAVRRMFSARESTLQPSPSFSDVASARIASRFPSLPPPPPLPPYVGSAGP